MHAEGGVKRMDVRQEGGEGSSYSGCHGGGMREKE